MLQSSDGMLFKGFSKDLEAYSSAFPSTKIIKARLNKIVLLPETATVLELLLQYMHWQCQPDIAGLDFSLLYALAEVVEVQRSMKCILQLKYASYILGVPLCICL
jgi:hypothetical protein